MRNGLILRQRLSLLRYWGFEKGVIRYAHLKYNSQGAQCFQTWLIAVLDTLHRAHT